MPNVPQGKEMVTYYLDPKVADKVRKIAKRRGVTQSYLVNEALWSMCVDDLISIVLFGGAKNADRVSRVMCRLVGDEEGAATDDDLRKIEAAYVATR